MYERLPEQNYIQQLSVDCVIFGYQDRQLKVLVSKLNFAGDFYGLPSGFIYQEEDIDQAAHRVLQYRTGIADIYLQQFHVFGKAARKNQEFLDQLIALNPDLERKDQDDHAIYRWFARRFVSIGFYALADMTKVKLGKSEIDESIRWYDITELPPMILDHREITECALEALRHDLDQKLNAFNLLPDTFTIKDVQKLYETIFDRTFVRSNFQKKILDLNVLERIGKKFTGAANKAPYLYRFKQ
ncbi:NUDIX hydrolase [Flavilitoribacter nigricans]|uniref:NUDIX hydrolase n=1 Tax=Flavilitoribacter nigricans (strain ATCC 23147 / DSM 23189 / NBRC 102662 / NCIMB 1420 / SS-2) TaxID=1122177 RepID=A0A2D0NE53_FLAN2|nr:NUDIX domain-containing protein [Flavilitoribacter nigricans]PHN06791.1 NUDIX hydrolase [Flavilitoribacter nigricans DSM 23189 = NBRC 102662]